ncbi:hypothetical protein ABT158_50230 [Nonomuraea sp. NPDC001636]|uniref:hypothetical protein n=1 Tax=Nonomuraea sp. NPDC001636 TaxID=3154391 RepID=UPI00333208C4
MVEATGPAAEVQLLADELRALLPRLQKLLTEPIGDPTKGTMSHHKISGSPAPWHPEAGPLLMDVHAGVRDLEVDLTYAVAQRMPEGRWLEHRGDSDENTLEALAAVVRLAFGAPGDRVRQAARAMSGWIERGRQIRDIGESEKWIPIRVSKGLPPACVYCNTFSLRVAQQSGRVRCVNPKCADENGDRPSAHIEKNKVDGSATLVWADGRATYYYESREAS